MKISGPVSFGMGAVMALVIGSGTAFAATGGTFILGKSNAATATTKLTNTRGTALALASKAGTPSLKINSSTKVTNLNADRLDNLDSSAFALAGGQTNTVSAHGLALDLDQNGTADTIVAVAGCPTGSRLTGGGGDDYTNGSLYVNSPLDKSSWAVFSTADVTTQNPADVTAYAVCYNPRGAVPGGNFRVAGSPAPTKSQMAIIRARGMKKLH